MPSAFYRPFDWDRYPPPPQPLPEGEYRTPFQIDRDRVVFSFAFRRLQSKTQVFQSGEYDFYRTRLTHSIEVAKLGRSICGYLETRRHPGPGPLPGPIDPSLTEAVCLAHDLGHPPFGHIGERKLNELMAPFGGFEGNAQTVRILTGLIYKRAQEPVGMHPTRALLDGVMKYKRLRSEYAAAGQPHPENHFLYDDQAGVRAWVLGDPAALAFAGTGPKSIECQIMDWADDTAYSLNDIADGIQAGYISLELLHRWIGEQGDNLSPDDLTLLEDLGRSMEAEAYERRLSFKLGQFVRGCHLVADHHPAIPGTSRHAWRLVIDPAIERECNLYKKLATDLIFRSSRIQQVEFKGSFVLERMFHALLDNYLGHRPRSLDILPRPEADWVRRESTEADKARRLCDFLAGLTDGEAVRMYRRLFDPDFGSITDLA